jgi:hypothetical protein
MLSEQLPLLLFWFYAAIALDDSVSGWLGASKYNLEQIRQQRHFKHHQRTSRYRKRPHITVVVLAHNKSADIERCLSSVSGGSYRNYRLVVIIDDQKQEDTAETFKTYMRGRSRQKVHLYELPTDASLQVCIMNALGRFKYSDIILPITADTLLSHDTLRIIQRRFARHDHLQALRCNRHTEPYPSLHNLLRRWNDVLSEQANKLHCSAVSMPTPGIAYRRGAMERLLLTDAPDRLPCTFAADATLKGGAGGGVLRPPRTVVGWLLLILEPLVLSYVIYLAIALHNPLPLAVAWLLNSLRYAVALLNNTRHSWKAKLALSSLLPASFLATYIGSFIRLLAVPILGLRGLFLFVTAHTRPALDNQ